MRRRFFVDRFTNGTARLRGEAAHHLGRVLRAEPGQVYELSDGETIYLGSVKHADRDLVEFALLEPIVSRESNLQATVLIAVVKFDRFEWSLEKAAELGAEQIVPVAADRSEKGLVAAAVKRAERWKKILVESAQQARRLRPPALQPTVDSSEAFAAAVGDAKILLSEWQGAPPLGRVLSETVRRQSADPGNMAGRDVTAVSRRRLSLAVGPEGGWTDSEFAVAREKGFCEASIGENILRTETAVVAGLAAAHVYFNE